MLKVLSILSKEWFYGSFSGSYESVNLVLEELRMLTGAEDINVKINYSEIHPFQKLKVRLKKEIVAMNVDDLSVDLFKG